MARYDAYSSGDDRIQEELDTAYIGFNNRLRPDQLTAGILAESKNGRLDTNGEWQTRKGMSNIIAPLSTGTAALTIPFFNIGTTDGDTDGITASKRLTITLSGIPSADVTKITAGNTSGDNGVAHVTASTLTGINPSFTDGIHSIRAVSKTSTSITYAVMDYTSVATSFSGGNAIIKSPSVADTAVNEIYGSCVFSDPTSSKCEVLPKSTVATLLLILNPLAGVVIS